MMTGGCLLVVAIKLLLWLAYWGIGHVALITLLDLPLSSSQIAGACQLLAIYTPVSLEFDN